MYISADKDGDNKINEADIEAECLAIGIEQFEYVEDPDDVDYPADHTI